MPFTAEIAHDWPKRQNPTADIYDRCGVHRVAGGGRCRGAVLSGLPILTYFDRTSENIHLDDVIILSTMLTSIWTFLLFTSCIVAQLLVPIDYLRRFTAFWFKDVEHHPLTAIAKVAATLIVIGALAIKVVRWVF